MPLRHRLIPILAALALCSCAPKSPDQLSDDTVQVLPDVDGGFLVLFLNRDTLMYNGDLAADRQRIIAARLQMAGCRDPRMLAERADPQAGHWAFGRRKIVYDSKWRC